MAKQIMTQNCVIRRKWNVFHLMLCLSMVCFALFFSPFFPKNVLNAQEKSAQERTGRREIQRNSIDDRLDAIDAIPALSKKERDKIYSVLSSNSLYRRLPEQAVYADPEMYQFLIEHPDVVVGFWEKMGVTQVSLRQTKSGNFFLKETSGTTATVEVLHRTPSLCIVYAKGLYRGPFLSKPYEGEVILILQTRFSRDEDNDPFIVCRLDAFVKIDNVGIDFIAKLFSNSLGKIADSNFEQTVGFVGYLSDLAGKNPKLLGSKGEQLSSVAGETREEFADLVERIAFRTMRRRNMANEIWLDTKISVDSSSSEIDSEINSETNTVSVDKTEDSYESKKTAMIVPAGFSGVPDSLDLEAVLEFAFEEETPKRVDVKASNSLAEPTSEKRGAVFRQPIINR